MYKGTICDRFLFLLVVLGVSVGVAHAAPYDDHPLISRYAGSVIKDKAEPKTGESNWLQDKVHRTKRCNRGRSATRLSINRRQRCPLCSL